MQDLAQKLSFIQKKEAALIQLEQKLQRWYIVLQEKERELMEQEKNLRLDNLLENHFYSRKTSHDSQIDQKEKHLSMIEEKLSFKEKMMNADLVEL